DFSASMYFRRIWYDDRLKYSNSLTDVLSIGFMVDNVWQPDIYFLNEKAGLFHKIAVPNILLQVSPDGRVILSTKYTLSLSCQFDLQLYPMDSQICNIEFGSYGYPTTDIILRWNSAAAVVLSDVAKSLPEYDVVKSTMHDCTTGYEVTGQYTCLRVSLHMRRKFNYYLIQVYIPSTLVVVLSWVSFWIDHHATPARITLSLLTVLTITTQSSSVTSGMPRVSYIKSIDVWLTGCLTFVFMALIEYAAVNVVQRKSGMLRTAEKWQRPKKLLSMANTMQMSQAQIHPGGEHCTGLHTQIRCIRHRLRAHKQPATRRGRVNFSNPPERSHKRANATQLAVLRAAAGAQHGGDTTVETEFQKASEAQVENNNQSDSKNGTENEIGVEGIPTTTTADREDEASDSRPTPEDLGWLFRHKDAIAHWLSLGCLCSKSPPPSGRTDAEFVDFLAKRIFPAAFLLFNTRRQALGFLLLLLLMYLLPESTASTAAPPDSPALNSTASGAQSYALTTLASSLLAPPYTSRVRPDLEKRVPVTVNISIHIVEVTATNEASMDFSTSMYFRRIWYDDRLTYNSSITNMLSIGFMVDKVWQPDIYFLNEKAGISHKITVPNILLQVSPEGRVILSTKYTLTLSCEFELELYPMDSQICSIIFGSFGYTTSDIILRWDAEAAVVLSEVAKSLPEYDVVKFTLQNCTSGYEVTGWFTCLSVNLHMRRKFNYYLIQVYIPSILVVVLSWVSFWIDHHATPARITLSLLTVLTVTTQSSSATGRSTLSALSKVSELKETYAITDFSGSGMPRVSYIKSIDIWLTGCLSFVFLALIEYAVVNVVQRKSAMLRTAERWQRPKKLLSVANAFKNANQLATSRAAAPSDADASQANETDHSKPESQKPRVASSSSNGTNSTSASNNNEGATESTGIIAENETSNERPAAEDLGWLFRHKASISHWLSLGKLCHTSQQPCVKSDAEFVDFLSKRIFPAAFLLFNTVYWAYYKSMQAAASNAVTK
uniref:Neur_chan_LBD domain-containing protein n=1 Tax=Macrostomum lignano TaxID=282301 RepID=A0A1I8H5L1_9PLAT